MTEAVREACALLHAGEIVALPTETVYGLAADASNPLAVAAIYQAKGRPSFNPLIAHVADLEAAQAIAVLDERALKLARAFWPGPLTLVAPIRAPELVCDLARAGLDTVAVRVPGHDLARAVLRGKAVGAVAGKAHPVLPRADGPCVTATFAKSGPESTARRNAPDITCPVSLPACAL